MKVDMKALRDGLNNLRGLDFEAAEKIVRGKNPAVVEVSLSKEFQARLAAQALQVPYSDVAELPLKQYARVTQEVFNFLFATSDDETPAES